MKVIGISANGLESHAKWIDDINEVGSKIAPTDVQFPIVSFALGMICYFETDKAQIADSDRKISTLYDMLDAVDATNVDAKGIPFTVGNSGVTNDMRLTCLQIRTVFVVDPKKIIRLTISYPAQTGRNFDEIIRVIDSLQVSKSGWACHQ